MLTWKERIFLITLIFTLIAIMAVLINNAVEGKKDWEAFKVQHRCVVIEKAEPVVSSGFGYGLTNKGGYGYGTVITVTPPQAAYQCDDGVVYWR